MKSPVIAVILVLLLVPAAGAAEPTVESFVLDDTTYGLQRPLCLYKSAGATGLDTSMERPSDIANRAKFDDSKKRAARPMGSSSSKPIDISATFWP